MRHKNIFFAKVTDIKQYKRNVCVRFTQAEREKLAFPWVLLSSTQSKNRERITLEAFFIRKFTPTINDQLDIKFLC